MWVNNFFEGFSEHGPSLVLRISVNVGQHLF